MMNNWINPKLIMPPAARSEATGLLQPTSALVIIAVKRNNEKIVTIDKYNLTNNDWLRHPKKYGYIVKAWQYYPEYPNKLERLA